MERSASNTSVIGRLARGGAIVALALGLTPLAGAQDATPDTATPGASGDLIVASTDPAPIIPDPVAGEVTVVAYGPLDAFNIPIIVVNGTDKAVEDVEIAVSVASSAATPAADAGGTPPADDGTPVAGDGVPDASVAVGEEGSAITGRGLSLFPDALEPGGVAIGAITFDGADVPANADLTFTVSSLPVRESNIDEVDVTLSDVAFTDGTFTGTATNDSNQDIVGSTNVRAVCQDADGNLTGYASAYLDQDDLAQGDSIPFALTVPPTIDSCDAWLISAGGRNY
jgi:hypothetical protein